MDRPARSLAEETASETETNAAVHIHNTSDTRWPHGWVGSWLAGRPAGPDSSSTPIPDSKSAAAACLNQVSSLPRSELGTKQLSQYFWLRRRRGRRRRRRLQIAIFNMLLQPEGGGRRGRRGLHILFPSDRCARAKNKAENPPLSPLKSQRMARRLTGAARRRRRRTALAASSVLSLLLLFLLQFPVYTKERRSRSVRRSPKPKPPAALFLLSVGCKL